MIFRRFILSALALVSSIFLGCHGSGSVVHGTVTYKGAPVNRGQITFTPSGGHGVQSSGPIENGKYRIVNVPPGSKQVEIIGVKQIKFARTHEEMAQAAEAAKNAPETEPETADEVPFDAEGNNQAVEVAQGDQELNFDLKQPRGDPAH